MLKFRLTLHDQHHNLASGIWSQSQSSSQFRSIVHVWDQQDHDHDPRLYIEVIENDWLQIQGVYNEYNHDWILIMITSPVRSLVGFV